MLLTFGTFTLDQGARLLLSGSVPVHLSPKAFDLLCLLADRAPEALSKVELHKCLWPGGLVTDVSLAVLVAEIRSALSDDAQQPAYVRTVHRFGYAFCAAVAGRPRSGSLPAVPCWVEWDDGARRVHLAIGENVLGRDPTAAVWIDAVGVSRRHASIDVAEQRATLHDLGSKNGTYAGGVRVTGPVSLEDDVEITMGPVSVRFRRRATAGSTETMLAAR